MARDVEVVRLQEQGWVFISDQMPTQGEDVTLAKIDFYEDGRVEQMLTVTATCWNGKFDIHTLYDIVQKGLEPDLFTMWRSNAVPKVGWKERAIIGLGLAGVFGS